MPKKKKKSKLSPEELKARKVQRLHRKEVRTVFTLAGFSRIPIVTDKEFTFQGTTSDFDDCFIHENVIVLLEYTTKQQSYVSEHLKKKKVLYDKIKASPAAFISFLDVEMPAFAAARGSFFKASQYRVVLVYCSLNRISNELKDEVPGVRYLDYQYAKYFLMITRAIRTSARFELFDFLGLHHSDIGKNVIKADSASVTYSGSILPEEHSYFGKDYKVVSFYVDPAALLSRCYVLRKDRWEEASNLYQRMISKKKIESIRKYLLDQKRVFVNNIILTLPEETLLVDDDGHAIQPSKLTETAPIKIQLPAEYNSIGLIDGQHRVFSYYEGGKNENKISELREQQNLLATGIVYPSGMKKVSKTKFEAKLFLEINATQTNAKSDLKQAIGLLLNPFSAESIAKDVLNHLNENNGPLFDSFERYFFEKSKLKTTSIVSYAIKPIVKLSGDDTFFKGWKQTGKAALTDGKDLELRSKYVEYCAKHLNVFFSAVKKAIPSQRWTGDKSVSNRMLTTTNINGLVICLRKLLETEGVGDFAHYDSKFGSKLAAFPFSTYKSSQYTRMGQDLFDKFSAK